MNKYYQTLDRILTNGKTQANKKGNIQYLLNEVLSMDATDLAEIFSEHKIAKSKLKAELEMYMEGITSVDLYNDAGVFWWDYCAPTLINSYPTYFKKLPALIDKINREKRPSKNYVLFIGETGVETNQLPCLSLIQFQISDGQLYMTVFQRSADSSIGLPSDIYQMFLISKMIDIPLANITFFIGNAHIYENNIHGTQETINGRQPKFNLNV